MDEAKLFKRIRAVKAIARQKGYPEHQAEEIAQQAAIMYLESGNFKQTNYQAYVDALRSGSENIYSRSGNFTQPAYEHQLHFSGEDHPWRQFEKLIDKHGVGFEGDVEEEDQRAFRAYLISTTLAELRPQHLGKFICYYFYGIKLAKISEFEGVTESRISQIIKHEVERLKTAVVQKSLSFKKPGRSQQEEPGEISCEVQERPGISAKEERSLQSVSKEKGERMGERKIAEVPQVLLRSF